MDNIRNKLKYFFDNYLIFIIILFGFLTLIAYSITALQSNTTSGVIYRGVLAGVAGILFILGIFTYRYKPPLYLIIGCGLYVVSNILTIFVAPIIKDVSIPAMQTLQGIGIVLTNAITVFIFYWMMKFYNPDKKLLNIASIIMVAFGLFLAIYSYITEWQDIINTFTKVDGWNYDVTSIFKMKTEYGYMLFICSLFAIVLAINNKKYWLYILPIFFLINMFISRSKTSILCTSLILICLLIYHVHNSWNKYKKRWIISFSIIGVILVTLLILTICKVGIFNDFNHYITQTIFNDAKVVLEDRFYKWGKLFKAVDTPLTVICGCGERIANSILSSCGCATVGDSIYVSNYGVGGIIKFTLYLAFAVIVIIYNFKSSKSSWARFIYITIEISIMIGGLFEDDNIIGMTYNSLFPSIFFYMTNKVFLLEDKEKMA